MITRTWHGRTHISKAEEYLKLMRTVAIPDYKSTLGNISAWALYRADGDVAHFLMVTQWESYEVIKAFAGEDIETAKYYDFDKDYLLEFEPYSYHYETYES
ncbi:MAG: antibiotic biosynthesis monooxygenase [Chloroflexota bacterium]